MARQQKLVGGLAATALLACVGALARQGTEKSWTAIAGTAPPTEDDNRHVDLKEAVAWALISGAVVGLTRLAVRRSIIYRGTPSP